MVSQQFSNLIRQGESISNQVDLAFNETGCNEYSLIRRLSTDNIKTCKELALIRSISALEVFIVDAVQEVFSANKNPFLSNLTIEYHIGEILSCTDISDLQQKYIDQKCRNLHSKGFEEIQKYYKKTFGIDFSKFSHQISGKGYGISFIQQYHEIRHLIVHRLGKTDEQYRKKYNCSDISIKLSKSDLSTFFEVLLSFALYIEKKMNKYIVTQPPENRVEIKVEIISDKALEYFEPTFPVPIKRDKTIPLSEIMESKQFESPGVVILQLHGTFAYIRRFYKTLLKKTSAGEIKVLSHELLSLASTTSKVKQFPWDDVEKVIELLPEKPWDKHIHKEIAKKLGWSNNKVSKIIGNIITEKPVQISIGYRRLKLHINDTYTFAISIIPQKLIDEVIWQTSDSDIIEIDKGIIKALTVGCADVVARIPGSLNKAVCTVTVIE